MLKYGLITIDVTETYFVDTKNKTAGDCFNNLPVIIHCVEALTSGKLITVLHLANDRTYILTEICSKIQCNYSYCQ